ncbi:DUF4286 family protein [Burkholderia multivorans]|uniref:DUF4286 family protein n=1 Tax=Burkholderia multivorans TaxID=87883 RepID=UPI0021C192F0|nr:DUF4286 family protein [Burkholderia multivorans]
MEKWLFMVESNCADPERENEFNDWYDQVHVPDLLKEDAFVAASRYEALPSQGNRGKFVALFQLETDDINQAMKKHEETEESLKSAGRVSDLLQIVSRVYYKPALSEVRK